ncbi:MAG: diguanylate cyclase [Gemmatimonadales bacterium]
MGTGDHAGRRDHALHPQSPRGARPLTDTSIDEFFQELRREYLAEAPARMGELRKDLAALRAGEPDAWESLKTRFHRLAGSGGSYGFTPISTASREAERWLIANPSPDHDQLAWLDEAVLRVAAAFDTSAREVGFAAAPQRPADYGWRAHLLGAPPDLAARLASVLRDAQYTVTTAELDLDPASVPATERPDLVVLAPPAERDPAAVVARWSEAVLGRRIGLALVYDPAAIDLLAVPFSRLDLVVEPDRAEAEVGRWAQIEGRAASSPAVVLVVISDEQARTELVGWLEAAGLRVTATADARAAMSALEREQADLVVADWVIPGGDGPGFIRRLRRTGRLALTPILAIGDEVTADDRVRALAAGAEDLLGRPLDRGGFVAAALHRAARGRHLADLVRRDPLTGFLTPAALADELESVFAYARRTGERFSFALFDVDHLRRINEQLGHPAGDQVLAHVARVIQERGRASDVFARMGGEEFGVVLRRCGPADAVAVAESIRAALASRPVTLLGSPHAIRLSAGVAAYPDHAIGIRELLIAAERALRTAKESGRDRVISGP